MYKTKTTNPDNITFKTQDNKPHNVCAYCRVSTVEEDQKNSLASQKNFFEKYFERKSNWVNIGIFADEGLSGTSLEKREDFKKMLSYAHRGKVEIILTKEVSRFSRNVLDLLKIVEELRNIGVYIWFLADDINTQDDHYREKLTQIALNAEQESLRTSRRVKWGQQQQMENGVVFGRRRMYGYNIVNDKSGKQHFEVVEDEARIIRKIFELYASGEGTFTIAEKLTKADIRPMQYKNGWSSTVILRILRNEKYVGDLEQGKTYTPDALTHKKKYNRGQSYRVHTTDHHPESAIIDRDLWNRVQKLLKEKEAQKKPRTMHSGKYWLSGKITCGLCNKRYVSIKKAHPNLPYKAWICAEKNRNGRYKQAETLSGEKVYVGCNALRVNDKVLKTVLYDIISEVINPMKEEILTAILKKAENEFLPESNDTTIADIERRLSDINKELRTLTDKMIKELIPLDIYIELKSDKEKEKNALQNQIKELSKPQNKAGESTFLKIVKSKTDEIISLDNETLNLNFYERIIKKIVVHPLNILEFHFSFMSAPIYLQYKTKGRADNYTAEFDVLKKEEVISLLKSAPKNE